MVEPPASPITADTSITIKCETNSSNSRSPEIISWYRNNVKITSAVPTSDTSAGDGGKIYKSELTFKAKKEDNKAMYECRISDTLKDTLTITVYCT
jgi:hypothetical protein